jgi:RNA polymerase sigma-70 factor (ECF subfamily)
LSIYHKTAKDIDAEGHLIRQAQIDPTRFSVLYDKYYKPVFVFIYRRTDDKDLTADLTSQVFLKAITHLPKYQHKGLPFSAWLFRIAVNEINMLFRKNKNRRSLAIEEIGLEVLVEEIGGNEKEEEIELLLKAIQRLALEEVHYIELRFFEGRSFKEIGTILEITENNAKVRTYRILDKIKKIMGTR